MASESSAARLQAVLQHRTVARKKQKDELALKENILRHPVTHGRSREDK